MSTSLRTGFAASTHLAEGQVMVDRQCGESVTLWTGTRSPVCPRRDGQFLKSVLDIHKKVRQGYIFSSEESKLYPFKVYWCTNSLTFNNSTFCPHTVFMCFLFIWEQTATFASYIVNWSVFITEMKSVYCAVRTGSLNKTDLRFFFKGLNARESL